MADRQIAVDAQGVIDQLRPMIRASNGLTSTAAVTSIGGPVASDSPHFCAVPESPATEAFRRRLDHAAANVAVSLQRMQSSLDEFESAVRAALADLSDQDDAARLAATALEPEIATDLPAAAPVAARTVRSAPGSRA